jgi:hypothetical protein
MAVDHYGTVSDEPLPVTVAREFDADLATALCRALSSHPRSRPDSTTPRRPHGRNASGSTS